MTTRVSTEAAGRLLACRLRCLDVVSSWVNEGVAEHPDFLSGGVEHVWWPVWFTAWWTPEGGAGEGVLLGRPSAELSTAPVHGAWTPC